MFTPAQGRVDVSVRRMLYRIAPRTPGQLHAWLRKTLGLRVPRRALVIGHDSPFDYLRHAFFEEARPRRNALVWAARGSGKTFMGAVATLLDMLFKPGIRICILGGSFAQSSRMHEHLRRMLHDDALADMVIGGVTLDHVQLRNGSCVEVLSQSQTAVRGRRAHRLRCDEVELFEPEVWEAAQLITRSGRCGNVDVRAGVEALSTMHLPAGLMSRLAADAERSGTRVFRWNVIDVLERCPDHRACEHCSLHHPTDGGCHGRAKMIDPRDGFFRIDDALDQHARIGVESWRSEMLCERPDVRDSVYPTFDPDVHVFDDDDDDDAPPPSPASVWLGGMDLGFAAPTVLLLARLDNHDVLHIIDEIHERSCATRRVIELARQRLAALGVAAPHNDPVADARAAPRGAGAGGAGAGGADAGGAGRLEWIGVDPAGLQRSDQTGVSTVTLWRRAGFVMRTRSTRIETGIALVRDRLRTADGRIGLRVHRRCVELIRSLRGYRYPPHSSQRDAEPVPLKDGHDHAADALRYLIINLDRAASGEIAVRDY